MENKQIYTGLIVDGIINLSSGRTYQIDSVPIISDTITSGLTTIAPSQNIVFAALATKAPINSPYFTGTVSGITATMVGAPSGSGTSTGDNTGDETPIRISNIINSSVSDIPQSNDEFAFRDIADSTLKKVNWNTMMGMLGGAERIPIADTDYEVSGSTNQTIAFTSISGRRVITLPPATTQGQTINVIDENGGFNPTNRVVVKAHGTDALELNTHNIQINPYSWNIYMSNGLGEWIQNGSKARLSSGAVIVPTYNDNNNGSITIGDNGLFNLYRMGSGIGEVHTYEITGGTFFLTNLVTNYVIADYYASTPTMRVTTDVSVINETTIIPLFTIYRFNTELHILPWKELGLALINKIHQSIVKTQRYRLESGLALGEAPTRLVTATTGTVWVGANNFNLPAFNSGLSGNTLYLAYHVGGAWTGTTVTQYNNTQYDDGVSLQTLLPNKYAVNFLYRGVEDKTDMYMVLGQGNYSLLEAQGSVPPVNIPPLITSHGILIGRIIVLHGASTATQIDSIFSAAFALSSAASHNDLSGLQGSGIGGEYYHQNYQQYVISTQAATNTLSGYVTSSGQTFGGIKTFTLSPIVPTPVANSNNTQVATTAYVDSKIYVTQTITSGVTTTAPSENTIYGALALKLDTSSFNTYSGTTATLIGTKLDASVFNAFTGSANITTTGIITGGTWQATIISPTYGGTGINNGNRTLTVSTNSGIISFSNPSLTLTVTASASVSGTNTGDQSLASLGAEAVANKATNLTVSNDVLYPTVKAVNDGLALYVPTTTLVDAKALTGFINGDAIDVSYNWTNRTVTLTGNLDYQWRGVKKTLVSPFTTTAHTATAGTWFLSITSDVNTPTWSQIPWEFDYVMLAYVNYQPSVLNSFCIRETHGLMDYKTHEELHSQFGTYRVSGGLATAGTYTENSATDSGNSMGFDSAVVKDEDSITTVPAWIDGTYTTMYVGAGSTSVFNTTSTLPFTSAGSFIQVNNIITGALTAGINNRWYNVYQIIMPCASDVDSQKFRMIMLQPQNTFTSLASAQAEDVQALSLGSLSNLSTEFVIYARITYITSAGDNNTGKCRISTNGITYILGNRAGQVNVAGFTGNNHLTLSNLTWTGSGHIGVLSTLAGFDAAGLATTYGLPFSSTYGGTGVNNGGRTLAINTNSGTLSFTNSATTLTIGNTASISNTNTGDVTLATNHGLSLSGQVISMGTPSSITSGSTNSVTTTTHSHALSGIANSQLINSTITIGSTSTSLTGLVSLNSNLINGLTLTSLTTGFSIAGGTTSKTLTVSNSITLAGTDGTIITLPATNGTVALNNQIFYIGTTEIPINRTSLAQALTGILSIDGSAGSVANSLTFNSSGTGDVTGTTYNGSTAKTISYNTIGASPLNSPTFTGIPTAPTAPSGTTTTQIATTAFVGNAVTTAISNLIASSPTTLDTLNEIAAALGDDPNFATTITTLIGTKLSLSGGTVTGIVNLSNLTASQNLELDASKNIISTAKATAFNKNYGVTSTDVKMNGVQAVGSIDAIARIDHVHPVDTSRQAQLNGTGLVRMSGITVSYDNTAYTTNTGTVTSVGTGTGLSGGAITTTGTINLSLNSLAEKTGNLVATDRLVGVSSTTHFAETISAIPLSIFSNDSGWTSNTGTITSIIAGNGLTFTTVNSGAATITMGTPTTINGITTNSVGVGTHSHALSGVTNSQLVNSAITIGSTAISLGNTSTTLAGLSSVTSTSFVGALTGNASTATYSSASTITNNITSAVTMYPTWVTATSGNLPIYTSSTKLSFIPSTGILTATGFSGSGASLTALNASNLSSGTIASARGVTAGSATASFVGYNGTTALAGQFDGGTTNPSGTLRLNYGGYFYPTAINLVGIGDTADVATHYYVETGTDGYVRPKTLAGVKAEVVVASEVLAKLLTVDGNGSGLDADTLDSKHLSLEVGVNQGGSWNAVPFIKTDGVIELGSIIDFHLTASDASDYAVRLTATSGALACSGNFSATIITGSMSTSLTFNNGGAGDATGGSYNGSVAKTISYNSIGASPLAGSTSLITTGTITTGTWNGSLINSTYGGTGVNNGGRTLAISTNSGTLLFSGAGTTLTIGAGASVSGTNTGDQTIGNGTLTLNVSGVGLSGSQTFTANQAGASTFTVTSNATAANTASTVVARDASGNFTAGTITMTGLNISTSKYSYQENLDCDTGTEVVAQVLVSAYTCAFFDYLVKNGLNLRAGTVTVVTDGTNVEFTEYGTNDLGNTSGVTFSADVSGGYIRLLATTTTNDWIIKTIIRGI